jgi:hypothetical protein
MIAAIRNDLLQRGILQKGQKNIGRVTPETAEAIRININELIGDNSRMRNRVGRKLKAALDNDVEAAYGADFFEPARKTKQAIEARLERARKTRRGKTGESLLTRITEDKINPDNLADELLSTTTRIEDIAQVVDFMGPGPALDELRSAVVADLYTKAAMGKTELGTQQFSGTAFGKRINKIGRDKLRAILPDDMMKNLTRLQLIGEMRIPASGTQLGLGPSAQAVGQVENLFMRGLDAKTGGFASITKDLFTKKRALKSIVDPTLQTEAVIRRAQRLPARMPPSGAVGAVGAGLNEQEQ